MQKPAHVFDGRRVLDARALAALGFLVEVGAPPVPFALCVTLPSLVQRVGERPPPPAADDEDQDSGHRKASNGSVVAE